MEGRNTNIHLCSTAIEHLQSGDRQKHSPELAARIQRMEGARISMEMKLSHCGFAAYHGVCPRQS
jgi:Fe-S-cluster-containing hydrogenase component 2